MGMMEVWWVAHTYTSFLLHGTALTIHMLVATSGQRLMAFLPDPANFFISTSKTPEGRSATFRVQVFFFTFIFVNFCFFHFFHFFSFFHFLRADTPS